MPDPITVSTLVSETLTVLFDSAVPATVILVFSELLIILSPAIEAITGTEGASASIVTKSASEAELTLPATSVALAVMEWTPFESEETAIT